MDSSLPTAPYHSHDPSSPPTDADDDRQIKNDASSKWCGRRLQVAYRKGHRYSMHEIRNQVPWPSQETKERVLRLCDNLERSYRMVGMVLGVTLVSAVLAMSAMSLNEDGGKSCDNDRVCAFGTIALLLTMFVGFPLTFAVSLCYSCEVHALRKELERVPVNGVYKGHCCSVDGTVILATYRLSFEPNTDGRTWIITGTGQTSNGGNDTFEITTGTLQRSGQASWQETSPGGETKIREGWFVLKRKSYTEVEDDVRKKNDGLQLELNRKLWGKYGDYGFGPAFGDPLF